jgi:hypothetical protein
MINPVAVEKLGFSEESRKVSHRKCPGDLKKSFVELPDAIQFLEFPNDGVFQQPVLRQNVIRAEDGASPCRECLNENRELSQECSPDAEILFGNNP